MYLSRNMKTCFSALVSWDYCFHFFLFIDEKIAIMIVFENQIDWYLLWSQLVENRTKIQQKDLKRFLSTVLGRYCCFFFLFVPTVLLVASLYRLAIPSRQVLSFQSIILQHHNLPFTTARSLLRSFTSLSHTSRTNVALSHRSSHFPFISPIIHSFIIHTTYFCIPITSNIKLNLFSYLSSFRPSFLLPLWEFIC